MEEGIKISLLIFGSGGVLWSLYLWITAYLARRRLRILITRETYDVAHEPFMDVKLSFEATNLGDKMTSLEPIIEVLAVSPKRQSKKFQLQVADSDRTLPSNAPKTFTATGRVEAVYVFTWYVRYRFQISSGTGSVVRYRNASKAKLSFFRFWLEFILFRFLNLVPDGT